MASRKMQLNLNIEELPNIKKRIADLTAERDAALARAEAAEQAVQRAWDEGYERGRSDHCDFYPSAESCEISSHNPYRRALDGTDG